MQKATLPQQATRNGRNYWRDKEVSTTMSLVAVRPGSQELLEVISLDIHRSKTGGTYYASYQHIHIVTHHLASGHGKASGYGYCRASQAAANAIESAGVQLAEDIGGVGLGAVEQALYAIGTALGYKKMLVVRHG